MQVVNLETKKERVIDLPSRSDIHEFHNFIVKASENYLVLVVELFAYPSLFVVHP